MFLRTLGVWNYWKISERLPTPLRNITRQASAGSDSSRIGLPMASDQDLFSLPHLERSDLEHIAKKVTFKALKIPLDSLQELLKGGIKKKAYKRTKFNFVRKCEEDGFRFILLDPQAAGDFVKWKTCPVLTRNNIEQRLVDYDVTLKYEDFNADEILRALLPRDIDVPTAFSRIGHIAHLNLREDQEPFKDLIGKVMLDKTHGIKTIVNKTNEISNQYRVFSMEVIAGENNFVTEVKEHHCTFKLDFSKVYWNPRLGTEHERIVNKLRAQVLFDMFAGIGPFAVPAAKRGSTVYANDLNPDSYHWLKKNAEVNKVGKKLNCYNLDGRTFITTIMKDKIVEFAGRCEADRPLRVHVAMNLPASAVEFLDVFRGLLTESLPVGDRRAPALSVHCYCFSKEKDVNADAQRMVEQNLGFAIQHPEIHNVRNVAPNKEMMCVSFQVPSEVLWADVAEVKCGRRSMHEEDVLEACEAKKQKLE